ncbi:MAG: hypothetical protein JW384_00952 [Nitrosomonadaceae bacterium]|jgi:hypothetical protein|nr:hypothetical protein [Nitrosomonadaceae bacterium]
METVMSRIGRMLGMRMHNSNRPVCPVPQSTQTVSSGPDTVAIDKEPKKKKRKYLKHTYMKTNDSIDKVREFRVKGLTYKAIGAELNISKQRVFQIIAAGKKRDASNNKWTAGLSSRNANLMEKLGIKDKETAIHAIHTRDIVPFKWPNFGVRSYHDLCSWLGTLPADPGLGRHCPHCGKTSKQ